LRVPLQEVERLEDRVVKTSGADGQVVGAEENDKSKGFLDCLRESCFQLYRTRYVSLFPRLAVVAVL